MTAGNNYPNQHSHKGHKRNPQSFMHCSSGLTQCNQHSEKNPGGDPRNHDDNK